MSKPPLALLAAWLLVATTGRAFTIDLDFTYDTGNFFGTHPLALASLRQAASDIDSVITSTLAAVPSDVFTGKTGTTTGTVDWDLEFTNPSTGATVTLTSFSLAADTVKIYVGMRDLPGNTLGVGGPGSVSVQFGVTGGTTANQNSAFAKAVQASNAAMSRGAGPLGGQFTGTNFGGYTLAYGQLVGNLWFDQDTNNDGANDTDAQLNSYWNFDISKNPTRTQSDFYSVALHEMLHSIGFGTSQSWDDLASGTHWSGAAADALDPAHGAGLITTDGHLADGYESTTLFGGVAQAAVMDPILITGERRYLTTMDAAILRDIGYTTIPEPCAAALILTALAGLAMMRPRR